ncbi:MAG: hypothetical protein P8J87_18705, partial [Verrucomicrobiales bacterium]|nr:hypothetical protein [Verrucomicrobiales bacterium]
MLLWKTHAGSYSGRLLDADSRATAVGTSPKSVLKQLKAFVEHYAKNDWLWEIEPDLSEPEFRFVKVSVVPEYRVRSRTFPGKDPLTLKLPCAVGRREGGMLAAVLPTVDVVFDFADSTSFENLVQHYVRHQLAGLSPRDLAPFLPPADAWIETLTVRVQPPEDQHFGDDTTTPLNTVADHLGDRDLRRVSKT